MPASNQRYILGEHFYLGKSELHKDAAVVWANTERRRGFKARIIKVGRGNYGVWTTRPFDYLGKK